MTVKSTLRQFLKIGALVLLLLLSVFVSSCRINRGDGPSDEGENAPVDPDHIHYWYYEDHPATCTDYGYTVIRCDCGEEYTDNYHDPVPHTLNEWVDIEPTCTEEGYSIGTCECGYTEKDFFTPPRGHYYYYSEEVIVPTCDKEGYTIITCTCGKSYIDNYTSASHVGTVYNAKAPICTEIGWDSYIICDVCGHSDYFEIDPLGHDYSDCEYIAPTCFEDGYAKGSCARCNEYIDSVVKSTGHTLSDVVFTDDYCGASPISYIYCTVCDDVIYDFGHNYKASAIKATCTQAGGTMYTCSKCGDTYSDTKEAVGHIGGEWITVTESTCAVAGEEICRCLVCDEIVESRETELKKHTFASTILETKIRYTCQVCGEVETVDKESYNNSLGGSASGGGGSTGSSNEVYTITFETFGGTNIAPIAVVKNKVIDLPIPEKEDCVFCGWYLDSNFALPFVEANMSESLTLYACWAKNGIISSQSSNIITGVDETYTFGIRSDVALNDSNLSDYISVKDRSNNEVSIYIKSIENNVFIIASDYYLAGQTYTVRLTDGVSFSNSEGDEIWFKINGNEYYDIVYRDDVILINESNILGTFIENGRLYLVTQRDMLSNGDVGVIYGDGELDIIYSFKVVSEKSMQYIYKYEITDADPGSIFESYRANIVTDIDISNIVFSETLEEEVAEAFIRSPLYAQFNYASILYAEQSSGNSRIKFKGIELKELYLAAKDESLIINFKAVANFVHINSKGKEYGEFQVVLHVRDTLKFPFEIEFRDVDDFTFILGVDNTVNVELYLTGDKGLIAMLPNFKNMFDLAREMGVFDKTEYDGLEINPKDEPGEKTVNVGHLMIPFLGFRIDVDLTFGFKFEATGSAGLQFMAHSRSQVGIQCLPGQELRFIESSNTDFSLGVFILGRVELYTYAKMEVGVSFAGIAKLYVEAELGPKLEFGGIFTAYTATGDKGLNGACGGYFRCGLEASVKFVFEISIDVFVDELKLFEAELWEWKKSWWIVEAGETDVPMYFFVHEEPQDFTLVCNENKIRLDDIIDNYVVLQDVEKGTFKTEEKECTYYLVGDDTKKIAKIIEKDGEYYLQVDDFIHTKAIEVRVVFGNISKTVVLNIELSHSVYMASVSSSTCVSGDIYYVRCSRCRDYFCGASFDDYKWISRLPTASDSGHDMEKQTATLVCPAYGGESIDYYVCVACEKLFYDQFGNRPVGSMGEIEEITGNHWFENDVCACGAMNDPPVEYEVSFDANGGECSPTTKIVTYNQPYGSLPMATRASGDICDYVFIGWYNEHGEQITEDTMVGAVGDHKLKAEWREIPYFEYQIYVGFIDNSLIGSTGGIVGHGKRRVDSDFVVSEKLFTIESGTDGYTMKTISWSVNGTDVWHTVDAVDGMTTIPANTFSKGDVIYIECVYEQNSCVASNSLITLADGTQVTVDSLNGNEMLLVWNMKTGMFDYAPIMFVDSDIEAKYEIIHLYFSDGTDVKVISEHGFWDYDLNKYVYLDESAADYIGHAFAKQNGDGLEKVTLIDVVIETELTTAWSPVTVGHLCYFVNGMLSMPGGVGGLFNIFEVDPATMTYDYEQIAKDIETYGLFTYEELNAICPLTEEMFYAAGGEYLKISIGKGNLTEQELINMITRYSKYI